MVNHDGAARWQGHNARVGRFDLMLNLKAREQRHIVVVTLHAGAHIGHDMQHELAGLFIDVIGINQNLADIRMEIITNRANDQAGFLINQISAGL